VGTEYWQGLIDWITERFLKEKMISKKDLNLFHLLDDPKIIVRTAMGFNIEEDR
jgi:hypothetical protein